MEELNKIVKVLFDHAEKECNEKGYNIKVLCTTRNSQDQMMMYCQGRTYAQAIKAGVPSYLADMVYRNKNIPNMSKKVNSLYSLHFEGKAIDIESDNLEEISQIFIKYGFAVKNKHDKFIHVEINSQFQNKLKYRLSTPELTNVIKRCLNNKLGKNIALDGLWNDEMINIILEYKKLYSNGSEPTINASELSDILRSIDSTSK